MRKDLPLLCILAILTSCTSEAPNNIVGKRVYIAKGNVSFILPDSTLTKGSALIKGLPLLWPPDSAPDGSYGEAGVFYHNEDTTTTIHIYVTAMPGNKYYSEVPWRVYANEKQNKSDVMAKTMGLAVIERYTTDSTSHTIEINYHLPKQAGVGRKVQASYQTSLTVFGRFRTIECHFSAPDNTMSRQELSAIRSSLVVNPAYISAVAKSYPQRQYQD
jgi:hypothetical protein